MTDIKKTDITCFNCKSDNVISFYSIKQVPVHSVLLMNTKEEAVNFPKGDIDLYFCKNCGFIFNAAFDPTLHNYSSKYEETQGFSETFNKFHRSLAERLIKKHYLYNKEIIEIGCGKGEFLTLLCEIGNNKGYGFDPAYISERNNSPAKDRMEFIKDFYSEKYTNYNGDFFACKMTLEHIQDTYDFLRTVRKAIADRFDSMVFFQVPYMIKSLMEFGFLDIYYEHCSYFTFKSLAELFRLTGFKPLELKKDYDDQYIMIEALPAKSNSDVKIIDEESIDELSQLVENFSTKIVQIHSAWKKEIRERKAKGETIIIWGGGSKAVAFLTTLGIIDEIQYAVDINPYKTGTFLAGNGQEIIAPDSLKKLKPDTVIVMNPIYIPEIKSELEKMNLKPEILSINHHH